MKQEDVIRLFDLYLNTCPEKGCRKIRTEEDILFSMAAIYPKLRAIGHSVSKSKSVKL